MPQIAGNHTGSRRLRVNARRGPWPAVRDVRLLGKPTPDLLRLSPGCILCPRGRTACADDKRFAATRAAVAPTAEGTSVVAAERMHMETFVGRWVRRPVDKL